MIKNVKMQRKESYEKQIQSFTADESLAHYELHDQRLQYHLHSAGE